MTTAWHVTCRKHLDGIRQDGLKERSYWATDERVRDYYVETIQDEGEHPLVIGVPMEVLERYDPEPDHPGLEEPLTHTLKMGEDEIWEEWEQTDQSWQACVDLIGSFRLKSSIPAEIIGQHLPQRTAPKPR